MLQLCGYIRSTLLEQMYHKPCKFCSGSSQGGLPLTIVLDQGTETCSLPKSQATTMSPREAALRVSIFPSASVMYRSQALRHGLDSSSRNSSRRVADTWEFEGLRPVLYHMRNTGHAQSGCCNNSRHDRGTQAMDKSSLASTRHLHASTE
jgi:hypothetical protein